MTRQPADVDGLELSEARPDAAWDAADGLAAVARSLGAALDALEGAPAAAVCWSGDAADSYRAVRERLARRTEQAAELASAGAGVVLAWLREAAPALAAMRSAATRVADIQRRVERAAALAYDPALDDRLQAELDDGYRQWHTAQDAYWHAVDTASRRLLALRDVVADRPLDGQDQVDGAVLAVWDGSVSGPATAAWALTGLVLVDRDRWWRNVSGLPDAVVGTVAAAGADPVGAGAQIVDWDAWREGHYGEAGGNAAVLFVPGPHWLRTGRDLGAVRFARNLADPRAPRPRLQTVDEILADGIDLARHEHYAYGHTLRRHVDVGDDYLMDRLTRGTLTDDAVRGYTPGEASRFTDRATAERVIDEALRLHADDLVALQTQKVGDLLAVTYTAHQDIGEVMTRAPNGFTLTSSRKATCVFRLGPDGIHLLTAYVEI